MQWSEETRFGDRLSRAATRNLFSWTLFTEGTRTEELSLWRHEWLEDLLERHLSIDSSGSRSSGDGDETKQQNETHVSKWLEDVCVDSRSYHEAQNHK